MIYGIGTDIVEVDRIRKSIQRKNFLEKIYTSNEIEYCKTAESLAGRWSAKESFMKAIGTGMNGGSFTDIEILTDSTGKPRINLSGKFKQLADNLNITSIFISISHEKKFATAVCILEI